MLSHTHSVNTGFTHRVSHTHTWFPLYLQCCWHAGLGRTEVALSRDVGGISTPGVPLCAAMAASSQTATRPPPPLQIPNALLNFPTCFLPWFLFPPSHCSLHALICALADSVPLSLSMTCLLHPPPLLSSALWTEKMTTVSSSLCCHYQCPSPPLCSPEARCRGGIVVSL